jgi:hypothetical protein
MDFKYKLAFVKEKVNTMFYRASLETLSKDCSESLARTFKCLWGPGIDSKE